MLPMLFAPTRAGELIERELRPGAPPPEHEEEWGAALDAAVRYWDSVAADARVSASFRSICDASATRLHHTRKRYG
jgi:hypothetical protein